MKKSYLNWSSGKDAAFALFLLQNSKEIKVDKLLTTVNAEVDRISMHGVRNELLQLQAESLQLPLELIELEGDVSMETYNDKMESCVSHLQKQGFTHSIFGDIFLKDLREYREKQLAEVGMKAVFPLWGRPTERIMEDFLQAGFKAITVCVNEKELDRSFCGRIVDEKFLADLPSGVDPCGENGEFHTFVYDGPVFKKPVAFIKGELVQRTYAPSKKEADSCFSDKKRSWDTSFWYCDLLPKP